MKEFTIVIRGEIYKAKARTLVDAFYSLGFLECDLKYITDFEISWPTSNT